MPVNMKRMISKELFLLIEEKPIDKINVQMLVTHCGISRQAFYYHFKDLADVYDWTCQEVLKDLKKKAARRSNLVDALQIYLDMAFSHRILLTRICESIHYHAFEQLLCQSSAGFLKEVLKEHWPSHLTDANSQNQFLEFYGSALFYFTLKKSQDSSVSSSLCARQLYELMFPFSY